MLDWLGFEMPHAFMALLVHSFDLLTDMDNQELFLQNGLWCSSHPSNGLCFCGGIGQSIMLHDSSLAKLLGI